MPQLTLHLLGPPRVHVDSEPVLLRRRKALALLVYLAVTRRPHSRDALATLLWPGYGQAEARGHLRRALNSLRRTVGHDWLAADRNNIALCPEADIWTDVEQFLDLVESCGSHGHTGNEVCPRCLTLLDEAVALYQDDFLAGFTLPDAPDFDAWQRYRTEQLRNESLAALDRLSRAYADRGEYDRAITCALRRLSLDAAHEPTHRHLMQLYAALGRQAAAFRQYDLCVTTLHEELGVTPAAETTVLVEEIRSGRSRTSLDEPGVDRGANLVRPPMHNLPAETTPFVGRLDELADLTALLADPMQRLITILGPGGIGKTRLAAEAAALCLDRFEHGLFFVSLAHLGDVDHIVPAMAETLDFQFHPGGRSTERQLLDYLEQRQLLLILDNFEHLLAGVDLVQELLQACPGLRLLVTSRERLQLLGETVYTLGSMDFPTWETPVDAQAYSAVQLFMETAQRVYPGRAFHADDLQYVARICRLVGGMPLGIILAATWVEVLSPQEIAAELTHGFDLLETQLRDLPERQRSMRAVLAYSWRRLDEVDSGVFMRLTVFRGGFGRDAAQMVAGATVQCLARLVEKSFVQRSGDDRNEIHELLRQYGEAQLEAAGEYQRTQAAHSTYYLEFLHQCEPGLAGADQLAVMTAVEADFENIRTAWRRAVQLRDYATVDRALDGIFRWFWLRRARQLDGLALLRYALKEWAPGPGETPHPVWVRISVRTIEQQQGPWLTAFERKAVEQALALAYQQDNRQEIAFSRWVLGLVIVSENHIGSPVPEMAPAAQLYEESLAYYRAVDARFHMAQVLENLGHCHRMMQQSERAIVCLQESLDIRCRLADRFGMARSLRELGFAAWIKGLKQDTEDAWWKAYGIQRELHETQGMADSLFFLCVLSLNDGDWRRAAKLAQETMTLAVEIENPYYQSWADRAQAIAMAMKQDALRSSRHLCSYPNAVSAFSARLFFALFTDDPAALGGSLRLLGDLAETEADAAIWLALAARLLATTGERAQATKVLALSFGCPDVASGWIGLLPEYDELKRTLQRDLSQPVFERAWHEGQQLDLDRTVEELRLTVGVTAT